DGRRARPGRGQWPGGRAARAADDIGERRAFDAAALRRAAAAGGRRPGPGRGAGHDAAARAAGFDRGSRKGAAMTSVGLMPLAAAVGANAYSAEIALVSYTLLILFRNILTGLREVPDEVLDAADGMGMTRAQMLLRVELPLALPAIVAGLRIAVVTTIALAT